MISSEVDCRVLFQLVFLTVILSLLLTAASYYTNAAETGTRKWKYETGNWVRSSPAIGDDGTIYVGSDDYCLYAINQDGSLKWKYDTGSELHLSPAIEDDGTIYVGSSDGSLYAINPDGTLKWKYDMYSIYDSPAIGEGGTIYVTGDDRLHAINPDGTLKWRRGTEDNDLDTSPAIGEDGTIYVGSKYFHTVSSVVLYAINPDGTLKWKYEEAMGNVSSPPAIGNDGTIYIGGDPLYAINPDGTLKWKYNCGYMQRDMSPVIGKYGNIYFATLNGNLFSLNADGTLRWKYDTGIDAYSSPAIGADGTIYVGSRYDYDANYLSAINPDGTRKWRYKTGDTIGSSPAIGNDGTIYFGSKDNYLHAVNGDSVGLAITPWPMFGHDLKHTGAATISFVPKNPPSTSIVESQSGKIDENSATFAWTGSDDNTDPANLTYSYKLEGLDSDWSAFSSTTRKTYKDLADGSYTFYVKAKDEDGKVDPNPASWTFTVDTTSAAIEATMTAKKPDGEELKVGDEIRYEIKITNNGNQAQQDNPGHEYVNKLPSNGEPIAYETTCSSGTIDYIREKNSGRVVWDGSIPAGETITLRYSVTVDSGPVIKNRGTINYDPEGDGTNNEQTWTDDPAEPGDYDFTKTEVKTELDLSIIDPVPNLVNTNNEPSLITKNETDLRSEYNSVDGVAADGVARVLLRVKIVPPDAANSVTFSLSDPDLEGLSTQDGELLSIYGDQSGQKIEVPVKEVDRTYAFAVYKAPDNFIRPEMSEEDRLSQLREVNVNVKYENVEESLAIEIKRPSVALVHGWNSDERAWSYFKPLYWVTEYGFPKSAPRFYVDAVNYRRTNEASFAVNISKVFRELVGHYGAIGVDGILGDYKTREDVAAAQLDLVTHSMGGNLVRGISLHGSYHDSNNNYGEGYFNKVINIDSPLFGSRWAYRIYTTSKEPGGRKALQPIVGFDPGSKAVRDLSRGSAAIKELTQNLGPKSHNIVGVTPEIGSEEGNKMVRVLSKLNNLDFDYYRDIFGGQDHDLVVGKDSQLGGFDSDSPATTIFEDVKHCQIKILFNIKEIAPKARPVLKESKVASRVIELLHEPPDSKYYQSLPKVNWTDPSRMTQSYESKETEYEETTEGEGVTITQPAEGSSYQSGEVIAVEIQSDKDVTLNEAFLLSRGSILSEKEPPFEFDVKSPDDYVGTTQIYVLGVADDETLYYDTVDININPSTSITQVNVYPTEINIMKGNEFDLEVTGRFSDYSKKDITKSPEISYSVADTSIATVGSNGVGTAKSGGTTEVTVTYEDESAKVPVQVEVENAAPMAQAGSEKTTTIGERVQLDASGSSDPDGDSLSWSWEMASKPEGSEASFSNPEVVDPTFTPDESGGYLVKLVVEDELGETNSDFLLVKASARPTLSQNWNIISPPGVPQSPDPAKGLGDDIEPLNLFYDYSPTKGYTHYPNDTESTELSWEKGYWLPLSEDTKVGMTANVPDKGMALEFTNPGWHLIGAPYKADWSQVDFSDPADFETDGAGHVRLVSWDPNDGKYLNHYSNNSYILDPWRGYWVKVKGASTSDPATITVTETDQSATAAGTKTALPQSVNKANLDYPPLPDHLPEEGIEAFVSPNPVKAEDRAVFSVSPANAKSIKVTIVTTTGKTVYSSDYQTGSKITWNLTDSTGSWVPNGLYLYQVSALDEVGEEKESKVLKLLVLR